MKYLLTAVAFLCIGMFFGDRRVREQYAHECVEESDYTDQSIADCRRLNGLQP